MFQKCLMASFEDRKFLQKQDLQIIKRLGLKFRGRNSWPLFRSYRPGYYPWFLTDREARFLALALQRSTEVSLRFKEDPDLFTPPKKNHYLVSVSEKGEKGLEWRDEWLKPAPITKRRVKVEMVDEARLRRIEREASRRLGVWETDFLLSPMSVAEKREERPYFPCLFMWVDHYSGLILHIHLTEQPGDLSELPSQLLNLIENIKTLPDRILVRKKDAFRLLKPVASKLKIKLKLVERLECLEEAMINMLHLLDTRSK